LNLRREEIATDNNILLVVGFSTPTKGSWKILWRTVSSIAAAAAAAAEVVEIRAAETMVSGHGRISCRTQI